MGDFEGPEKSTLDKLERPLFTEYHVRATRYSDLNQTEQKSFMNARHIYETDLKEYIHTTSTKDPRGSKQDTTVNIRRKKGLAFNR
jgi:hypothetical protein